MLNTFRVKISSFLREKSNLEKKYFAVVSQLQTDRVTADGEI